MEWLTFLLCIHEASGSNLGSKPSYFVWYLVSFLSSLKNTVILLYIRTQLLAFLSFSSYYSSIIVSFDSV